MILLSNTCHVATAIVLILLIMTFTGVVFVQLQSRFTNWIFSYHDNAKDSLMYGFVSRLPRDPRQYDIALLVHSFGRIELWWDLCTHMDVFYAIMAHRGRGASDVVSVSNRSGTARFVRCG